MQLEKDTNDLSYIGFTDVKNYDNTIYFNDGCLDASAYSYSISSAGSIELNKEQTYEIYLFMKEFYENQNT